jgi:peptidylprolyl isomerase
MHRLATCALATALALGALSGCAAPSASPTPSSSSADDPLYIDGLDLQIPAGYPDVSVDDEGDVVVDIPDSDPPTETEIAVMSKGDGPVVEDGDVVELHFHLTHWESGKTIDETWGGSTVDWKTEGGIEGLREAVIGQTVGSAIMAILPPRDDDARALPDLGVEADDTLVFVLYIVGVES